MPDNNVAETARSPSSLPCLSVWSHGDDVSGVHVCVLRALKGAFKIPCNRTDRWQLDDFFTSLILCAFVLHFR